MVITMIDTKYKIKSKKNDIFPFINGIIMVLFVIVTLYPVLNTLAISLNDGTDALRGGIYLWPRKFTWKNYTTVLHKDNLITYTQKLLVSPSPLYKRNVGIIPPFTYMVMTQNKDSWERNKKRLRLMM